MSKTSDGYETVQVDAPPHDHVEVDNVLQTVFEDGKLVNEIDFAQVRKNAKL